jgi:hypothetical protein
VTTWVALMRARGACVGSARRRSRRSVINLDASSPLRRTKVNPKPRACGRGALQASPALSTARQKNPFFLLKGQSIPAARIKRKSEVRHPSSRHWRGRTGIAAAAAAAASPGNVMRPRRFVRMSQIPGGRRPHTATGGCGII